MPKARLVFDGDGVYTEKEARVHKLTQETETKIDNIPGVVDDVNSTSTTDALSANMGKHLQDQINTMTGLNKFLSTWDCTTGLPVTDPSATPFTYTTGNYYLVGRVADGGTNYRPHGNTFTPGVASTAVETETVNINDMYIFDGSQWILQINKVKEIIIDDGLDPESTHAVENRAVYLALTTKQDKILDLAEIRAGAASGSTAIQPGNNITELTNNAGYQTAGDVAVAIEDAIDELAPGGVGRGVLTLQKNGANIDTFSADAHDNKTINITMTKSDVGLSNVDNTADIDKPISTATQAYVDNAIEDAVDELAPDGIGKGILTLQKNGTNLDTFSADAHSNKTINITMTKSDVGLGNVDNTADIDKPISTATQTYVDNAIEDAIDESKYVGPTAPSNPTEGMLWYDTTENKLKVYNGSEWVITGKEYTAGEGIEIESRNDYSAMRGPCPDGYHIPLQTERRALYNVGVSLGIWTSSSGTPIQTYLKMPFAGYRDYGTGEDRLKEVYGTYRSSTGASTAGAYFLFSNNNTLGTETGFLRAYAFTVRPFKDTPVVPDSNWTTLYQGTGNTGVFWNTALGLISMSSDGNTRITIADKNLGATNVYNEGDTLSEANCGGYFQWGNNYMFPFAGNVTTSDTQVDASNYGPGNYYSSSTFITVTRDVGRRDTTNNINLWGGEIGIVHLGNVISNTGVLSINGQNGNLNIKTVNNHNILGSGNIDIIGVEEIQFVTQTEYEALPSTKESDGKAYFIYSGHGAAIVSDEAFGASWDGITTQAPSKNAIYDILGGVETLLANL